MEVKKKECLFLHSLQFYESNRRKTHFPYLRISARVTLCTGPKSLLPVSSPSFAYHAITSKGLIQIKYTLDSYFFTVSHLEYKFPNSSRVPKYCFAWKARHYLENRKYQYHWNTDIKIAQSNLLLIPCCIF